MTAARALTALTLAGVAVGMAVLGAGAFRCGEDGGPEDD